jgi:hypothetical protein
VLPDEVRQTAEAIAKAHLVSRYTQFIGDVSIAHGEMAARGMATSGMWTSRLRELCERELTARAEILWDAVTRAGARLAMIPVDGLTRDFGKWMALQISAEASRLAEVLGRSGWSGDDPAPRMREFEGRADLLVAKYNAEAEVFVDHKGHMPGAAHPTAATGTTINVAGDVYGVIQSGAGATAWVTTTLDAGAREAVSRALAILDRQFAEVRAAGGTPPPQLVEVMEDVRAEIAKPQPNGVRVKSLLTGLALSIQTAGALKAAYDALKTALLALGITLP